MVELYPQKMATQLLYNAVHYSGAQWGSQHVGQCKKGEMKWSFAIGNLYYSRAELEFD